MIFMLGTAITLLAPSLGWLMLGRAVQGFGSAGINPLCIAIISQLFAANERGKVMGTWNSIIPLTNMIGPSIGGLLIDQFGWRSIYLPIFLGSLVAMLVAVKKIPNLPGAAQAEPGFLRRFDWGGVTLLAGTLSSLLFFASSRPVTGVAALQDWRLLAAALLFLTAFIYWEKRRANPFLNLTIFKHRIFSLASVGSGIRMFSMSGINFLMPLYLVDLYALNAATSGIMLTLHATALLLTIRFGGQMADRLGSRWPVALSMAIQTVTLVYLALLPADVPVWLVGAGIVSHGLGAGLSLAALHRAAMDKISEAQTGVAAGIYSMIRFGGSVFGTALGGVLLQAGLDMSLAPVEAYQAVFWFIAGVSLIGMLLGLGLKE
jgi:MFS family permease